MTNTPITVTSTINAPVATVWTCWTEPACITKWNAASDDWHCPRAEVDLKEGGKMTSRMEARDGNTGFDFSVTFTKVVPQKRLDYVMDDGRKVSVMFEETTGATHVAETFDPEGTNPIEMQRDGWQSILDAFKKHAEAHV